MEERKVHVGNVTPQLPTGLEPDVLKKIQSCKILIIGLNATGAEIAKNLLLIGAPYLSLYDTNNIQISDIATSFLLRDDDIGKNRAQVYCNRLSEYREHARVSVHDTTSPLTATHLSEFDVVCMTEADSHAHIDAINTLCRAQRVPLLVSQVFGAMGFVFNDFGDAWQSTDLHCQKSERYAIEDITGTASVLKVEVYNENQNKCRIQTGAQVILRDLANQPQLNNRIYTAVKANAYCLSLEAADNNNDTTPIQYTYGGCVEELPVTKAFQFQPFSMIMNESESNKFTLMDSFALRKIPQQRALIRALFNFKDRHNRLPKPWDDEDANHVLSDVQSLIKPDEPLNASHVIKLIKVSRCHLPPVINIIAGIAAHEVIKCVTNTGTPIDQVMLYDAAKCLPSLNEHDIKLTGTRDDVMIEVFGNELARKIQDANVMIAGAGGIGSEIVKQLGLMGTACHGQGVVKVLDSGTVNKHHLASQSLYHQQDIEKSKARALAERAQMNDPRMNVKYLLDGVTQLHQHSLTDHWRSADLIFNTMSGADWHSVYDQAVFFKKPMVDCGVDDGLGHATVIVPPVTEPRFPEEFKKASPSSKLHFPSTIEPCVRFARYGLFCPYYSDYARAAQQYATNRGHLQTLIATLHSMTLKSLKDAILHRPKDFEDCIRWALKLFHKRFYSKIVQLLHAFPLDYVDSNGDLFWKGHRRPPTPLTFNANDALHVSFVETAAMLRAEMYYISTDEFTSLDVLQRQSLVEKISTEMQLGEFVFRKKTDEESQAKLEQIRNSLPDPQSVKIPRALALDKYNEQHVTFVHLASTLQARAYKVLEVERWETARLAFDMPKVSSAISTVAGLACIEYIKVRLGYTQLENLRNNSINLNVGLFNECEPLATHVKQYCGNTFTAWDKIELQENMTLQGLLNYFLEKGIKIDMLGCGSVLLYASYQSQHNTPEYLNQSLSTMLKTKSVVQDKQEYVILELCGTDADENEIEELPTAVYYLKGSTLDCEM